MYGRDRRWETRAERDLKRDTIEKLLVTEYQGLLALLHRKARDPQLAADILNDAIVTTLEKFDDGKVSDPSGIAGYVYQVAMNKLLNVRRKFSEDVNKRADLNEHAVAAVAAPEGADENWAQRVRAIVEELPSVRDRDVIQRFYLQEEEKTTICEALRLSALQFDKIVFRARKRMRSLIENRGLRKGDFLSLVLAGLAMA
jgi:RNA polymerase sigma-70 factor, ECF subfamily